MHPATDLPPGGSSGPRMRVRRLGVRSFADGCALQERAAVAVEAGSSDELLYVEHRPVVTLGRTTAPAQLLASRRQLAGAGISVVETDRGGGATYHGPGQIVGYPIIDLRRRGIGVRRYLRGLEAALIEALQGAGVGAFVRPALTGVWTEAGKIAAIGIAVRRGITRHGFSLNVDADLHGFDHIVPCGLHEPVTSLRRVGWQGNTAALTRCLTAALESRLDAASRAPLRTMPALVSSVGAATGHEVGA